MAWKCPELPCDTETIDDIMIVDLFPGKRPDLVSFLLALVDSEAQSLQELSCDELAQLRKALLHERARRSAAQAIQHSTQVSKKIRARIGAKGSVLDLSPDNLSAMFRNPADQAESLRLRELVVSTKSRRSKYSEDRDESSYDEGGRQVVEPVERKPTRSRSAKVAA
jgi:hypothetical protein